MSTQKDVVCYSALSAAALRRNSLPPAGALRPFYTAAGVAKFIDGDLEAYGTDRQKAYVHGKRRAIDEFNEHVEMKKPRWVAVQDEIAKGLRQYIEKDEDTKEMFGRFLTITGDVAGKKRVATAKTRQEEKDALIAAVTAIVKSTRCDEDKIDLVVDYLNKAITDARSSGFSAAVEMIEG